LRTGGSFARTGIPEAVGSTAYNAANHQTTFADKTLTYDNNGNLQTTTDASGTTTYIWNARNQLVGISGPGVNATFVYDGVGRREMKTINSNLTEFLYDGLNPVQETSGAAILANILPGLGIDELLTRTDVVAGTTSNFLADALGSTVALTDGSGTVQTEYTYDPFGKASTTGLLNSNLFQYTRRETDDSNLYYYRARYYEPIMQRFVSEDPIRLQSGDINFYAYARNNPIIFKDPYGRAATAEDCTNTSPICDQYGPCDEYAGSNARCFCKCAGNDEWSQTIRCCLRKLYDSRVPGRLAHWLCYGMMIAAPNPTIVPTNDLKRCYEQCSQEQKRKCSGC
jgi:RHS repeat-associated protein